MKSRYDIILIASVMGLSECLWYSAYADQQSAMDDGVNFGKNLVGDVKTLSTTTDVTTVPGYAGDTNLPQTNYYNNQDLNGLQTDAMVGINNGTANDASQYAYQKSLQPKLQFGANDPILSNSGAISTNAMANPDVLTVQTGNCNVANVNTAQTRLETCTSWLQPTQQTCNKTLNVDVKWDSISSCPIGTSFSQVQATHNSSGAPDIVYARAYCNPGSAAGTVDIQLKASDGDPHDCTSWVDANIPDSAPNEIYTGALLRPSFYSNHQCGNVPAFIQGGCDANNQCDYTITYRELRNWTYDGADSGTYSCYGTAVPPTALPGYTGPGALHNSYILIGSDPQEGYYCVERTSSVNLTFEKPHITKTPTVTDTWNDGCGLLEAQVK